MNSIHHVMGKRACLEDIREHGADSVLAHTVLVLTVKVVKEMDIVQWVLILHREVNAVLTQDHIILLQTHTLEIATAAKLCQCLQQNPAFPPKQHLFVLTGYLFNVYISNTRLQMPANPKLWR